MQAKGEIVFFTITRLFLGDTVQANEGMGIWRTNESFHGDKVLL